MDDNVWFGGFQTPNGPLAVFVWAESYADGDTIKHRNHWIDIRLNDEIADRLSISDQEAEQLGNLLTQAATHIRLAGQRIR